MEDNKSVAVVSTGMRLMPTSIEDKLHLCDILVRSHLLPKEITKKEEAFAILAYGHELGYGPMESFQKIFVVNGRPGLYANALLEKARNHPEFAGIKIKSDSKGATITLKRQIPGQKNTEEITLSFGEDDAKRAGLMKEGSGYQKYPERMYRARVISWACRDLFPDAANNMMSVEELEGMEYEKAGTLKTITMDLGQKDDDNKPILEAIQITKAYEETAQYFDNDKLTKDQKTKIAKGIKNNTAPSLIKMGVEKWLEEIEQDKKENPPEEKEKPDKKVDKKVDKKESKNSVTKKQDKKLNDLLKTHVLTEEEKIKLKELADDKEGASTAIEIALNNVNERKKIEKFVMEIVKGVPELTPENLKALQEKPGKQSDLRDYILNETPDLDPKKFNNQIKGVLNL